MNKVKRFPLAVAALILLLTALVSIPTFAAIGDIWAVGKDASGVDVIRVTSAGSLVPGTTNTYALGTSGLKWASGYFTDLTVTGTLSADSGLVATTPAADDTTSLGDASHQWANLYVANSIYNASNEFRFPQAGGVFVTTAGTLTLTNKTLTSPTVSGGTINNAAIGGSTPAAGAFTTIAGTTGTFSDTVTVSVAGKGLQIKEGSNARMGVATLSSGEALVSTTAVGATSRVFVTGQSTTGACYTTNRVNGTSFAIYSTDVSDSGDAAWVIIDPAP